MEHYHLRQLAVNLGGWFGWLCQIDLLLIQFTVPTHLNLVEREEHHKILSFKIDVIQKILTNAQIIGKKSRK
jgi:hypothetical protein